jgi:hypothetical protein
MRRSIVALTLLLFGAIAFAAPTCSIRFMNVADPNAYYFNLARDLTNLQGTLIVKNPKIVRTQSISESYEIEAGSYYICGTYDKKEWGNNNQPTVFEKGKEYFIVRVKSGEGYVVIIGDEKKRQ